MVADSSEHDKNDLRIINNNRTKQMRTWDNLTNMATNNSNALGGKSTNVTFDKLSVEELFEKLKLECDDSVKELDRVERQRKETEAIQREILDKINWKSERIKTSLKKYQHQIDRSKIRRTIFSRLIYGDPIKSRSQIRFDKQTLLNLVEKTILMYFIIIKKIEFILANKDFQNDCLKTSLVNSLLTRQIKAQLKLQHLLNRKRYVILRNQLFLLI